MNGADGNSYTVLIPLESGKFLNFLSGLNGYEDVRLNPFGVREVSKHLDVITVLLKEGS